MEASTAVDAVRRRYCLWSVVAHSEVTENADVIELLLVAVSRKREQEGPLEAHEAPNTRHVEALGV